MYKQNFSAYLKTGLLAGIITVLIANLLFVLLGLLFDHQVSFIGMDRDTLYIVFISFATFVAVIVASMLLYLVQKYTKLPMLWLTILVIIGLAYNTYTAEVDLASDYKLTAHILHFVVSGLALYLIPKFSRIK